MSRITSTQVDNAKDVDFVMSIYNLIKYSDNYSKTSGSLLQYYNVDFVTAIYNLIKYSDNYSKTSGSLLQYYGDEPNYILTDSELFKYKTKITGKTPSDDNPEDV